MLGGSCMSATSRTDHLSRNAARRRPALLPPQFQAASGDNGEASAPEATSHGPRRGHVGGVSRICQLAFPPFIE